MSYPPDIARRRRQLGLPVTPEEHVTSARGEMRERPVTRAQMAATLRAVAPDAMPRLRAQFLALADAIEAGTVTNPGEVIGHLVGENLGHAVREAMSAREPGEDDDDNRPAWWDR